MAAKRANTRAKKRTRTPTQEHGARAPKKFKAPGVMDARGKSRRAKRAAKTAGLLKEPTQEQLRDHYKKSKKKLTSKRKKPRSKTAKKFAGAKASASRTVKTAVKKRTTKTKSAAKQRSALQKTGRLASKVSTPLAVTSELANFEDNVRDTSGVHYMKKFFGIDPPRTDYDENLEKHNAKLRQRERHGGQSHREHANQAGSKPAKGTAKKKTKQQKKKVTKRYKKALTQRRQTVKKKAQKVTAKKIAKASSTRAPQPYHPGTPTANQWNLRPSTYKPVYKPPKPKGAHGTKKGTGHQGTFNTR